LVGVLALAAKPLGLTEVETEELVYALRLPEAVTDVTATVDECAARVGVCDCVTVLRERALLELELALPELLILLIEELETMPRGVVLSRVLALRILPGVREPNGVPSVRSVRVLALTLPVLACDAVFPAV